MNVTDALSRLARERPDALAILTPDGTLTFAELDRAVSAIAGGWRAKGLVPGDAVILTMAEPVGHLVASLALARLGAGQLVIQESDSPVARREMARRVDAVATVGPVFADIAEGASAIAPPPDEIEELKQLKSEPFIATADPELTLFIMRSSGTTGVPKVCALSHAGMVPRLQRAPTDVVSNCLYSFVPISFEGAKQNAYRFLLGGGCIALFNETSVGRINEFVLRNRIDFIAAAPSQANVMLDIASGDKVLFPDVKAFRLSTTVVPQKLRESVMAHITPNLFVAYGATEIGVIAYAPPDLVRRLPGTVGFFRPDVEAEIIDENGQVVGAGIPGVLRLRTPAAVPGYIGDPEETAKRFRDGWFYTGDRCEFSDGGALIHHGRADEMIIHDGINIHPTAIEAALLEEPAVAEVAVFGVSSARHGTIPVAAVVLSQPGGAQKIVNSVRAKLGRHALADIMVVEELPRTTAGKVVKSELVNRYIRAAEARKRKRRKE